MLHQTQHFLFNLQLATVYNQSLVLQGGMGTERYHSHRTVYHPNWRVTFPGLPCDNIVTEQHEGFLLKRLPWNSAVILVKKTQRDVCWMNSFSRLQVDYVRHNSLYKNEGKSSENNHMVSLGQWILRFLPWSAFKEARELLKSHRQEAEGNTKSVHTGPQVITHFSALTQPRLIPTIAEGTLHSSIQVKVVIPQWKNTGGRPGLSNRTQNLVSWVKVHPNLLPLQASPCSEQLILQQMGSDRSWKSYRC